MVEFIPTVGSKPKREAQREKRNHLGWAMGGGRLNSQMSNTTDGKRIIVRAEKKGL